MKERPIIQVELENEELNKVIEKVYKSVKNLTIPLSEISKQWYRGNKIYPSGKKLHFWDDLSPKYATRKRRALGSEFPLLKWSGLLYNSIKKPTHKNAIHQIINKRSLIIGTNVKYAAPMHYGVPSKNIPPRPFLFIGPEQIRGAKVNGKIKNARLEAYKNIFIRHFESAMGKKYK